jgi:hypothetical protein
MSSRVKRRALQLFNNGLRIYDSEMHEKQMPTWQIFIVPRIRHRDKAMKKARGTQGTGEN